jgi:hypothetical protein
MTADKAPCPWVARSNAMAGKLEVLGRHSLGHLNRTVIAQQLVDGTGHERGRAPEEIQLIRGPKQGEDSVVDEVHGRFVPGHEQEEREIDNLIR